MKLVASLPIDHQEVPVNYSDEFQKRFWSRVDIKGEDDCWNWTAGLSCGYGMICFQGKPRLSHRISWEMKSGVGAGELFVLHSCNNPACVNPKHLSRGTYLENIAYMIKCGRNCKGEAMSKALEGKLPIGERNGSKTHPERVPRGTQKSCAKLTEEIVADVRRRYAEGGITHRELAEEFGINRRAMGAVINRENWKHVP